MGVYLPTGDAAKCFVFHSLSDSNNSETNRLSFNLGCRQFNLLTRKKNDAGHSILVIYKIVGCFN